MRCFGLDFVTRNHAVFNNLKHHTLPHVTNHEFLIPQFKHILFRALQAIRMQIPTGTTTTNLAVQHGWKVCRNVAYSQRNYAKTIGTIQTTSCKNSGDTLPSWRVRSFPHLSHTATPFPPLSMLLAIPNHVENFNGQHWKGEREGGGGKWLNSRFGANGKVEKVFFNGSVSPFLQLVVACNGG